MAETVTTTRSSVRQRNTIIRSVFLSFHMALMRTLVIRSVVSTMKTVSMIPCQRSIRIASTKALPSNWELDSQSRMNHTSQFTTMAASRTEKCRMRASLGEVPNGLNMLTSMEAKLATFFKRENRPVSPSSGFSWNNALLFILLYDLMIENKISER